MKRLLAIGVIILFLGMSVFPSTGISSINIDKTTSKITVTLNLYKQENMNYWCVNDVKTTLSSNNAVSDRSATFSSTTTRERK